MRCSLNLVGSRLTQLVAISVLMFPRHAHGLDDACKGQGGPCKLFAYSHIDETMNQSLSRLLHNAEWQVRDRCIHRDKLDEKQKMQLSIEGFTVTNNDCEQPMDNRRLQIVR